MTTVLNTKQLSVPQTLPLNINVQFVKPESYEFRVAEVVDETGKIIKVNLQVKTYEHDEWGTANLKMDWIDVPRFKFDVDGRILP